MVTTRRAKGDAAEQAALEYLERAGLELLDRNVSSALGEIDLLMRDGEHWVFVEVRARSSRQFGGAAASVTPAKQRKLQRQAQVILKRHFGDRAWPPCRFDVCAVQSGEIDWIRDAF